MKKKLTRNTKNALLAGVISGLADYFNQDVVLFRLLTATAFIFTGFFPVGVLYIIAWVIMPEDSEPHYEVVE